MARVYVSIGSNIDRERQVREGVRRLAEAYGPLVLSPVYETAAIGFEGEDFYNLVAAFDTDETPAEVVERLHAIEAACGRRRGGPRFAPRTLDIDLLLYDDRIMDSGGVQIPREEITRHAFVLKPLADLAPDAVHPLTGESFAAMWAAFDASGQRLRRIDFDPAADLP
ncbi:2-amino-4-hydroxy-6-hydroxymethyldihydropteridine diphosphokinase [Thiohalobacter sp. IOR34]|uniref:2-amino-4-hydroxy-6- hydroxymethyldihydropteridine diphosphokinase n=1 Tax=Thiohalobacter sp. IOR34 TaxID=3057176 RepID=UPI0025B0ED91|nr:2-amino-4-hydroxy-6-hydroxymethyldihydropteridine diphosphokinase [Thiohalobacter sp. IOR34]WJW75371.1 2-amino-4-hydroxy-6-hydroxymethyldihydropteridine diphosphokinase [Thiohalobacter sp. IOR34]